MVLKLKHRVASSAYRIDLLANYLWAIIVGMLGLFLMPIYSRLLGFEQWGGVALGLLIQNMLGILDAGLSQTMPRDVAAAKQGRHMPGYAEYLSAYVSLAGLVVVGGGFIMPFVSEWWITDLALRKLSDDILLLATLQVAVQMCNAANMGYWSGRQQQALAIRRSFVFSVIKHAFTLLVLLWLEATARSYFICILVVSVVEFFLNTKVIYKSERRTVQLTLRGVRAVFKSSRGLTVGVLIGMGVTQLDRLYFSREFGAAEFGVYAMTLSLGLAFMHLQYPVMQANMPRVVSDVDLKLPEKILRQILVVCGAPCAVAVVFAEWLLSIWLGSEGVPSYAVPMFRLLVVACFINAVYHVYYQYMVAINAVSYVGFVNGVSFLLAGMLLLVWGGMGGVAGGWVWFVVSLVQLFVGWFWFNAYRRRKMGGA